MPQTGPWSACKKWLRNRVGAERISYLGRSYADYVLWDAIYHRFLHDKPNASALELGSAPGRNLVRLGNTFGLQPFGVEYSEAGVMQNRGVFRQAGIPEDHVIFADAFSADFLGSYSNRFDTVFSNGVIEHFTDPSKVIDVHIAVVKPGGLLLVSIPNYRWTNWLLKRIFDGDSLPEHNLNNMKPEVFRQLFANRSIEELYCAPYGSINVGISQPLRRKGWRWACYLLLEKIQLPLNLILRTCFGANAPNSRFTSPFLLYVGRKADPVTTEHQFQSWPSNLSKKLLKNAVASRPYGRGWMQSSLFYTSTKPQV